MCHFRVAASGATECFVVLLSLPLGLWNHEAHNPYEVGHYYPLFAGEETEA